MPQLTFVSLLASIVAAAPASHQPIDAGVFAPVGPRLLYIVVDPINLVDHIPLGRAGAFTARGHYADGTSRDLTSAATWSVSNSTIAAVSSGAGRLTTRAVGQGQFVATLGAVSGQATLIVSAPEVLTVAVSPASATVAIGKTTQFKASGTFTDGLTRDISAECSWSSSAGSVAELSNEQPGVALGRTAGAVSISAQCEVTAAPAKLAVVP